MSYDIYCGGHSAAGERCFHKRFGVGWRTRGSNGAKDQLLLTAINLDFCSDLGACCKSTAHRWGILCLLNNRCFTHKKWKIYFKGQVLDWFWSNEMLIDRQNISHIWTFQLVTGNNRKKKTITVCPQDCQIHSRVARWLQVPAASPVTVFTNEWTPQPSEIWEIFQAWIVSQVQLFWGEKSSKTIWFKRISFSNSLHYT